MTLKSDARFEKKHTCGLEDKWSFVNFHQSTQKSQNYDFDGTWGNWRILTQGTEELCSMVPKIDAKFEGNLTCAFKNDMRN